MNPDSVPHSSPKRSLGGLRICWSGWIRATSSSLGRRLVVAVLWIGLSSWAGEPPQVAGAGLRKPEARASKVPRWGRFETASRTTSIALFSLAAVAVGYAGANHTVIKIGFSLGTEAEDSAGGLIIADADNDHKMDYLITAPGHLAVLANDGRELWRKSVEIGVGGQIESEGLPRHHGPGVAAADVDGDGRTEVVFLTKDSVLHIFENRAANPRPDEPRLWQDRNYGRLKQYHNYYSP